MNNGDMNRARAYYYEFFATPFLFSENDESFKIWQEQMKFLSQNPINESAKKAFDELMKFDFNAFKAEQNDVLFNLSYANVPLTASFYEEGRDDGVARIRVIDILKKAGYVRNFDECKVSEDYVGFIFSAMAKLLGDEKVELANELFKSVINGFVDELCEMLDEHSRAKFYLAIKDIMSGFFELERAFLALSAPFRDKSELSPARIALNKKPYQSKMPTMKSKINMDEITL
ncbi:TorD/DmsD family molecular chaperone [Campylobacter mucosalis]|uniref:TorD/DmsD family molecular chaperone n=1 Tax=Campylobacter mucosalis TaxID=202 RepID=UPI001470490B|nr:molecular chaperone TorD family protein [Campylobacter mucosalis]